MLTKSDCLSILVNLESAGINGTEVNSYVRKVLTSSTVPIEVLQFIVQNNGVEAAKFYEFLRKKHNKNRSPLYTNILSEELSETDAVTTLSCLLVQIVLYGSKLEQTVQSKFNSETRAAEITRALNTYFTSGDSTLCAKVLSLLRTDLLVVEALSGRREIQS